MKPLLWMWICVILASTAVQAHVTSRHVEHSSSRGRHKQPNGLVAPSGVGGSRQSTGIEIPAELKLEVQKQKVWLNFTEANKQIVALIKNKYKSEKAALKKPKKLDKKKQQLKECHSMATMQCGCQSLKAFEQALKKSSHVAVENKCKIRQRYFECLSNASKAECKGVKTAKGKSGYQKQKQVIVDALWTTRECLLGPVSRASDTGHATDHVKINTDFCKKLTPHKSKTQKKPKRKQPSK